MICSFFSLHFQESPSATVYRQVDKATSVVPMKMNSKGTGTEVKCFEDKRILAKAEVKDVGTEVERGDLPEHEEAHMGNGELLCNPIITDDHMIVGAPPDASIENAQVQTSAMTEIARTLVTVDTACQTSAFKLQETQDNSCQINLVEVKQTKDIECQTYIVRRITVDKLILTKPYITEYTPAVEQKQTYDFKCQTDTIERIPEISNTSEVEQKQTSDFECQTQAVKKRKKHTQTTMQQEDRIHELPIELEPEIEPESLVVARQEKASEVQEQPSNEDELDIADTGMIPDGTVNKEEVNIESSCVAQHIGSRYHSKRKKHRRRKKVEHTSGEDHDRDNHSRNNSDNEINETKSFREHRLLKNLTDGFYDIEKSEKKFMSKVMKLSKKLHKTD